MAVTILAVAAALAVAPGDQPAAVVPAPVAAAPTIGAPAAPKIDSPAKPAFPDPAPDETVTAPPAAAVPAPSTSVAPANAAPATAESVTASPPAAASAPGDIVIEARKGAPPGDPMIGINQKTYEVVDRVDGALIAPMSAGYEKALPSPIRAGIRHFLSNLTEPVVALNFLLQIKPGKAAETLGRFAINSTVGIGGIIDVAKAKPINLPYRRNGLAYTLGYYGVGPGPYLFLPIVGPTTLRDVIGLTIDRMMVPLAVGKPLRSPYYVVSTYVVKSLDDRALENARFTAVKNESANPYKDIKDYYLQQRQAEIDALKGRKPATPFPSFVPSNEP